MVPSLRAASTRLLGLAEHRYDISAKHYLDGVVVTKIPRVAPFVSVANAVYAVSGIPCTLSSSTQWRPTAWKASRRNGK